MTRYAKIIGALSLALTCAVAVRGEVTAQTRTDQSPPRFLLSKQSEDGFGLLGPTPSNADANAPRRFDVAALDATPRARDAGAVRGGRQPWLQGLLMHPVSFGYTIAVIILMGLGLLASVVVLCMPVPTSDDS